MQRTIAAEGMMDPDSPEDPDIRLFREEYPDVYEFVTDIIDGICDDQALEKFGEEYGEDTLRSFLKLLTKRASHAEIKEFEDNYPTIVSKGIKQLLEESSTVERIRIGDLISSCPWDSGYEIFDVLGEGGCGIVYLVYSQETKSAYALKTFRDDYLNDIQIRRRFRREAQVWIDLERHPYLVKAYRVEEIAGRLYILMEYIAPDEHGLNSLHGHLQQGQLDLIQCLRWAIQFCYGMEYAYSKGIKAHRDIKPANIMISQDMTVKICDFGLAGIVNVLALSQVGADFQQPHRGGQTVVGTAFGTPQYMPPEQFASAAQCDERSDIYSFGIVLYQMASGGRLPFYPDISQSKSADSFHEWYKVHCKAFLASLNSPLLPVIEKCLVKAPTGRYQRFRDLRADLEVLLLTKGNEVVKMPELRKLEAWEWINKGASLELLEMKEEAITCYAKALEINPIDADTWCRRGVILSSLDRDEEAIICYNRALEVNPTCDLALDGKGFALRKLNKYEEAIACYSKLLDITPDAGFTWFTKGDLLRKLGKYEEAIACYDKALYDSPKDYSAWYGKGDSADKLNRPREAIIFYEEFLKLAPSDDPYFARANKRVEDLREEGH